MAEPFLGASTVFDGNGFQQVECLRSRMSLLGLPLSLFGLRAVARFGFRMGARRRTHLQGGHCRKEHPAELGLDIRPSAFFRQVEKSANFDLTARV